MTVIFVEDSDVSSLNTVKEVPQVFSDLEKSLFKEMILVGSGGPHM